VLLSVNIKIIKIGYKNNKMSYINAIKRNNDVLVWERVDGKRRLKMYNAPYYFYTKSDQGTYTSMYGDKLERHDFNTGREFNEGRAKIASFGTELFESDIPIELKVLSQKYYEAELPKIHVTLFDIEVDYDPKIGYSTLEDPYAPINSIAYYNNWQNRMVVIAVPPSEYTGTLEQDELLKELDIIAEIPTNVNIEIKIFKNEKEMLIYFLDEIEDSDLLSGWNSEGYDIPMLGKRLEIMGQQYFKRLSFHEGNNPKWKEEELYEKKVITLNISGRVSLDYMLIFKKFEVTNRPSYSLENISDEILIDGDTKEPILPKLHYTGSLADLYHKNFINFLRYNLRDTEVLLGFEQVLGYVELANIFVHQSTGLFKHVTGTIKLSELATINHCHYNLDGTIVNDTHPPDNAEKAKGAFVLIPQVGEHDQIGSVDINSLYPSVIRSNNISPEMIVGQFQEDIRAFEEIRKESYVQLTLKMDSGEKLVATAEEWREALIAKGWGISGYGTVFSLNKQGIMSAILEDWYKTRKKFQAKMIEAKERGDNAMALYYKKIQHVYKIKLNSYYGSLLNAYFRFYDKRMGESTTATSRLVLLHQCAKVTELLDGKYVMPDKEVYDKEKDVTHIGYSDKWSVIYGDSVAKDTNIILEGGKECKIEQLFKRVQETVGNGKEYYFPKNTKTLTYDEKTNKSTFKDVIYVMRHKIEKKMYRVWVTNSTYVDVTEDHSLIGYKNTQQRLKGESCLTEVKPCEIGEKTKSLIFLKNIPRKITKDMGYSKEIYEFMGMLIGDGFAAKESNGGVSISIGSHDIEEITKKLIDSLVDQGYITSYKTRKNTHDVRMCGTKIYHLIKESLYSDNKKRFPKWIFDETVENISSFLRGYFSADGTVTGDSVSLCSVDMDYIKQTQQLLFYCGISSNYFTENVENSYNGVYSGTYSKHLIIKNIDIFKKRVGFIQDRKNKKIPTIGKERKYLSHYDFTICRGIQKIEEIEYNDYVYDIEVGNTHVFFANNILVHNTDSSYFRTHGYNVDETTQVADILGDKISESFPEFMREAFLCTDGFDNIIKTGREIIADKGIFVDKKRYMLHVVDNEGFKCDDLKVMGLETKKTAMPKFIAIKINGWMKRYLTGADWDDIAIEIVDFKDELRASTDYMQLGITVGIKNVEKYTADYATDKKCFLPGHVAGAIFFNECLEKYGDTESLPIISGMKIKKFMLKKQIDRFKAISIPADLETIPEWFIEHLGMNYDEQITRLIDKPLTNIIKAIDKESPSRQSLSDDSLLEF